MGVKSWLKILFGFIFFMSVFINGFTQQDRRKDAIDLIEKRIEFLLQSLESTEVDLTSMFDDLYYLYENPLNLNEATRTDLEELMLLNDYQINQILLYKDRNKGFATIYELATVKGMDRVSIEMILPFITVSPIEEKRKTSLAQIAKYGRHELILRHTRIFPSSEGYSPVSDSELVDNPNARYLGSPDRVYARYRFQYGQKISIGITGEKDPGEEFFRGSQPQGFDFYSAHIFLRDVGPIKRMALGDYNLQIGQGLIAWTGYGFRKSPSATVDLKRYGQGIRAYTSADENNFLRGGASIVNWGKLNFTGFYSQKNIDGNVNQFIDTLNKEEVLSTSSLQQSGMHRTPGEIVDKDVVKETVFGGAVEYDFKNGKIGALALASEFSPPLSKDLQLYQLYQYQGAKNANIGLNYHFNMGKFSLYGEGAMSQNQAKAFINGLNMNLDQRFKASVVHRHYETGYHNLYGDGFGEKSGTNNENGIYIGAMFYPIKQVAVSVYFDQFDFPWLSYQVDAPSRGNDFSGQITYSPQRNWEFIGLYRRELKDKNSADITPIRYVEKELNERYRVQMTTRVTDWLTLRTRVEWKNFQEGNNPMKLGYMIYQDMYFDFLENKLSLNLRYALFETDDYDSRIYAYEHDLRYQFSVPVYYSKGSRAYGVLRYQMTKNITVNMKLAQTFNALEDSFGSGKDEIIGNTRTELKSQLIFKF